MVVDLVIKNGHLVIPKQGIIDAGIAVEDGKIVAICSEPNLPKSDKIIDAEGKYVLPGVIDPHTHYGHTYGRYRLDFGENVLREFGY